MLPISSNPSTQASLASSSSNTTTQSDSTHAEENAKAESVVQISESCVVSNQLYGQNHIVTTNFFLTDSDPNTKLIFEKLNAHAEAARYKPLAQLGTQIEGLRTVYLNVLEEVDEIRDGLALYIPSEGQEAADSKTSFTLIDKVREFLSSSKKVLLLLGEAGSGKSTFNRDLTRTLWSEYQQSPAAPIPIFIALAEHTPSREDLIESYLLEQEFSPEAITVLRKEKRLVFILDGFDEIKDHAQAFYTHNKLDHWKNAQVIISSRPEYLGENYRSQFQKRGQVSALQEYWFSPTSDDWITAYIQKYIQHTQRIGWDLARYQNTLNNLPTLKEAIRRPFLLRMALDLLPDLIESKSAPMTRIALYDAFILRWWNRSEERLLHITLTDEEKKARRQLGQHLVAKGLKASQEMAMALTQKRLIQASYDPEKDEIVPEAWRTYLNEKDAEKRLLLFNAPLIHQGQHYRFIHKSIQDYCVARAICSPQFSDAQPCVDAVLNQFLLVDEALILDFLVERVNQHPAFKAHLHAWIEASKDLDAVVTVGAANAITILVRAGVQFNGENFNGIKVPGADLSYGVFDSAKFKKANLSGADLRGTWLRQADFKGADLVGANFGGERTLKVGRKVHACCYSLDGHWLAVGTEGEVRLYQADTLACQQTFSVNINVILSVAFSPDSKWLASGDSNTVVRLWSVGLDWCRFQHIFIGHQGSVRSVTFSPDNKWLASGSDDGTIKLWSVTTDVLWLEHTFVDGMESPLPTGHLSGVTSVTFSPDGKWLASSNFDKTIKLWSVDTEEHSYQYKYKLSGGAGIVNSVMFSPNSKWLVSGNANGTIKLWSRATEGRILQQTFRGHLGTVRSVTFSPDNKWLASGSSDGIVKLWSVGTEELKLQHTFEWHAGIVQSVTFSSDSKLLASGSFDGRIRLWSVDTEERTPQHTPQHTSEGHLGIVKSVTFSPDGKLLASGSADSTIKLWLVDMEKPRPLYTFIGNGRPVMSIAFSPDSNWLASGSLDGVRLWSLATEGRMLERTFEGHAGIVPSVAFSPNSQWLASGSFDGIVKLWFVDIEEPSFQCRYTFTGHFSAVASVIFSPDGQWLFSGGFGGELKRWSMATERLRLQEHFGAAGGRTVLANSGHWLASSSGKATKVWSVDEEEDKFLQDTWKEWNFGVYSMTFSPNGKWLALGSDKIVHLWSVDTEKPQMVQNSYVLKGHAGQVNSVAFSPDSQWLASGSEDWIVNLWLLDASPRAVRILGLVGGIASVAWQTNPKGNALPLLATGGADKAVRLWRMEPEGNFFRIHLCWTSYQVALNMDGTNLKNARLV